MLRKAGLLSRIITKALDMDFVLNDETRVNSHGFILLNGGGDLERFRENPVMLHNHNSDELVGAWENIRIEGSKLLASPKFDTDDAFANGIEGKVSRGFLKGASLGIIIQDVELRSMPDGNCLPFVTRWEALESSICGVPSNAGALKLYNEKGAPMNSPEQVQLSIDSILNKKSKSQKMDTLVLTAQAYMALGIEHNAECKELSAAIVALHGRAEKAELDLQVQKDAAAVQLVTTAIAEGRLSSKEKDDFTKLAIFDYGQAERIIKGIPARQMLADKIRPGQKTDQAAGREDWDYKKWAKEDPAGLKVMKNENPDAFEQLAAKYR